MLHGASRTLCFEQGPLIKTLIHLITPALATSSYQNKFEGVNLERKDRRKNAPLEKEIREEVDIFDKNALGFHKSGMWSKVVDIDKCYLQTNISNKIRNYTKQKALELNLEFFDLKTVESYLFF